MPILCAGAGYGVVKLQNSRRRRLKIQQEHLKNAQHKGINKHWKQNLCYVDLHVISYINNIKFSGSVDKMVCREWVHASYKRLVKLRLGPEPALHVTDRKGDKLRTVPLDHTEQLTVLESQARTTSSIQIHPSPSAYRSPLLDLGLPQNKGF